MTKRFENAGAPAATPAPAEPEATPGSAKPGEAATFERMISMAEQKSTQAAALRAEAEKLAQQAGAAQEEARAAWDAVFGMLKRLKGSDKPGYAGSKLARLLNYVNTVEP